MTPAFLMTKRRRLFLTFLTVLLCYLSLPGNPLPLLALISLVPLGLAVHSASPVESFFYAYVCGFLGWLGSTTGLTSALSSYVRVSSAEAVLFVAVLCAYLALPYGLFGLFYGALQWMNGKAGPVKTAACLTVLVSTFPTPLPFDSSHALYGFPVLIQCLDLGGQPFLLFMLCLVNWLIVDMILRIRKRQDIRSIIVSILAISIFMPAYGYVRLRQYGQEEAKHRVDRTMNIAVIQPNIPLEGDSDPHSEDSLNPFHTLLDMSAGLLSKNDSIELVVWPETPTRISCEDESGTRPQLTVVALQYRVPFLVNCVQSAPNGGDYNTELFVSRRGEVSAYHKRVLLPFTEYIPGEKRFPFLRKLAPGASRYVPGRDTTVFRMKNSLGVFPVTCYEVLFTDRVRESIHKGGNILITAANDAWFGSSRISDFVTAAAVYQAIAYRVPVVRASNSGGSVAVRANGAIVPNSKLPVSSKTIGIFEVFAPSERSPYSRVGNAFLYSLTLGWILGLFWDWFRRPTPPR